MIIDFLNLFSSEMLLQQPSRHQTYVIYEKTVGRNDMRTILKWTKTCVRRDI